MTALASAHNHLSVWTRMHTTSSSPYQTPRSTRISLRGERHALSLRIPGDRSGTGLGSGRTWTRNKITLTSIGRTRRGIQVRADSAPDTEQVIVGDIGGTNARFQLWDIHQHGEGVQQLNYEKTLPTSGYDTFEDALGQFLKDAGASGNISVAAFAVAGPVANNRVQMTNISWVVDKVSIEKAFDVESASVLNDFEAVGYGCHAVRAEDLLVLNDAPKQLAHPAVCVGPGTGLGEALITFEGNQFKVWPSEGGHVGLAPRGPVQRALVEWLERETGEIELELCCSGMGLVNIHRFLCEYRNAADPPDLSPADVSIRGMAGEDPLCVEALEIFIDILGYEASNLGLKALAFGGVYVAGGIPPKIKDQLLKGGLLKAFLQEGTRFGGLRAKMPLYVVLDESVGLLGAKAFAIQNLRRKHVLG